jgi:hypothetical protein
MLAVRGQAVVLPKEEGAELGRQIEKAAIRAFLLRADLPIGQRREALVLLPPLPELLLPVVSLDPRQRSEA